MKWTLWKTLFVLGALQSVLIGCGRFQVGAAADQPLSGDRGGLAGAAEPLGQTTSAGTSAPLVVEEKIEAKQKPAVDLPSGLRSEDIVESGAIIPTVYFFAVFDEDKNSCQATEKKALLGTKGVELALVCPETFLTCSVQGSCAVVQNEKMRSFNILARTRGQDHYFEIPDQGCKYGYGVEGSCLDPFRSVAADLILYRPGDVIYLPALVGLKLPDGSLHDGYLIVRDQGRGIQGRGRFDFFSGTYSWRNPANPFVKMGLGDSSTRIPYYKVSEALGRVVKKKRSYPQLPKKTDLRS